MSDPAVDALLDLLRSSEHCFVKRPDAEAPFERMRDWDIVVPDVRGTSRAVAAACGPPRHVIRRSYVVSLFYSWGIVDLFDRITWWGATIVSREALFAGATDGPEGLRLAAVAHEAVVAWFVSLLFAGSFKERYVPLVERAVEHHGDLLARTLADAAGGRAAAHVLRVVRASGVEATEALAPGLRRAVLLRSARRRPFSTLAGAAAHSRRELQLRGAPPLPALTVSDDDAVRGACAWVSANARVATGVVLVEGQTARVRRVEVGEPDADVLSALTAQAPTRIGGAGLRSLGARGWVVLRRGAAGVAGEAAAYAALEAALGRRARSARAGIGLRGD